jgi:predicted house-cleaning NTP pyrophosphatase (Maf/HAM1 superfamily)
MTAVTLLHAGQIYTERAVSPVRMRPYSNAEVEAYIATGDPFDKAGGYAIQHQGFSPVHQFDHCFANVMGLPLCHVARLFTTASVQVEVEIPTKCQAHLGYTCEVYPKFAPGY